MLLITISIFADSYLKSFVIIYSPHLFLLSFAFGLVAFVFLLFHIHTSLAYTLCLFALLMQTSAIIISTFSIFTFI
ncbi:hypothetical protein CW304_25850 [Bacillus sp. UFRGS-B20]|nr:hypothetical protein CW304_25850 [Bacillus sp. UFRGS-B20]